MRVLQVVHALPPDDLGGTELYTANLAAGLADRGHDVAVAAPRGGEDLDVPTVDLPAPDSPDLQDDPGLPTGPVDPAVDARFDELLDSLEPDVVHLQHFKGLSSTLPARCRERGVASVATLHDFFALCHREQLYRPDGRRCSGPDSVEKCTDCYLAAVAGNAGDAQYDRERDRARAADGGGDGRGAAYEQYADIVERRSDHLRRALAAADRLVAPSEFLRERYVAYGTPREQIVQLRNGVRVDRFADTGFDGAPVRFGFAGRVAPEKGVHLLVEAFDRVDGEAALSVFGEFDPAGDDYHARLARRAGEGVRFRGRYDDPAEPYRAADVLVLPSVWYENSPLVIQEARAAGLPVVASDLGGMAELVDDGVDGLTFPVGDPAGLADRLARLVDEPTTVERLRAGVSAPVRLDEHAAAVESLYRNCLTDPGSRAHGPGG